MRNRYAGTCFICSKSVGIGMGWFQSVGSLPKADRSQYAGRGKWLLRCLSCKNKGNKPKKI